jgi:hypothetical protein
MKNNMLMACGLLIVLNAPKLNAQNCEDAKPVRMDTIQLVLQGNDQVHFIGSSLKKLSNYNGGDSIKMLFITDWTRAVSEGTVFNNSRNVHYFVHRSGKRRLKAESPDFATTVNTADEIRRLDLNLPSHHFVLHDLERNVEMHLYLADPSTISEKLGAVSFNEALSGSGATTRELRKNYHLRLQQSKDGSIAKKDFTRIRTGVIEMKPAIGLSVVGNQTAPFAGIDLMLALPNKYGIPQIKFGPEYTGFVFADMHRFDVQSMSFVQSLTGKFAWNIQQSSSKPIFFGLEGGMVFDSGKGNLDKGFKMGMFVENQGPFTYGFHWITARTGQTVYGVAVKFPF